MNQPYNPPAFPLHNHGVQTLGTHISGMTLRDYFAAKALQGYMSRQLIDGFDEDVISEMSYKVADAMLKAREA
ncbi:MAG: hypothetical protein EBT78_15195 [Betaproteobacteria bacterium]|nr:hypothetical protein [Betaproteobacteria bacterium]